MRSRIEDLGEATHKTMNAFKVKAGIFNDQYMKRTGQFGVIIKNVQSAAMDLAWLDS